MDDITARLQDVENACIRIQSELSETRYFCLMLFIGLVALAIGAWLR